MPCLAGSCDSTRRSVDWATPCGIPFLVRTDDSRAWQRPSHQPCKGGHIGFNRMFMMQNVHLLLIGKHLWYADMRLGTLLLSMSGN